MSGSLLIPVLVAVGVLAGIAALFQLSNSRGSRNRGRRRAADEARAGNGAASQRKMDVRVLSVSEKRLYAQAKTLLVENKVQAGARILEQLNMQREAIQALEDASMIHEAAKVLMRMGRHNRAGVVYARHGMWLDAASSFKMAQMPLEVAKCAREAGRFDLAAEYFDKAGRLDDAADCHEKLGDLHRAARLFASAGNAARAMALYAKYAENAGAALEGEDVSAIFAHVSEGNLEPALVDALARYGKVAELVLLFIGRAQHSHARDAYQRANGDIGPKLMSEVSYRDQAAEALAQLFLSVEHFQYAGMVFERMTSFERAGAAFEAAEDFERSAYCFERAGRDDKAKPMRAKAERAEAPVPGKKYANPGFALSNLPTETAAAASFGDDDVDSTAVVDTRAAPAVAQPTNVTGSEGPELALPPHLRAPQAPKLAVPSQPTTPELPPRLRAPQPNASELPPHLRAPQPNASELPPHLRAPQPNASELPPHLRAPQPAPAAQMPPPLRAPLPAAPVPPTFALGEDDEAPAAVPAAPLRVVRADAASVPNPASAAPPPAKIEGPAHAAFHRAKFLSDLDFEQRNALWTIGESFRFDEGDTVLTYEDEPKGVYVITGGTVACYRNVGGKETFVDQMSASETFGELWLLADQPTAVRFIAQTHCEIRVIGREGFNELMDKDGTLARKVYKRFTLRLLKRLLRPQNSGTNQQAS